LQAFVVAEESKQPQLLMTDGPEVKEADAERGGGIIDKPEEEEEKKEEPDEANV